MRICTQCGSAWASGDFCPMDGARLVDAGAGSRGEAPGAMAPPPVAADRGRDPLTAGHAPDADALIGQVLAQRYRIDARLGVGGMGIVYRATHVVIDKTVAVKVLKGEHARVSDVASRFSLEARLASKIKHPNVVDIFDYGSTPAGSPYYVMEFLPGHSLAWEIDHRGPLEPNRAVRVAIQIAQGLAAAHEQGVVHRDLKPDNVFLLPPPPSSDEDEHVTLLDFGIARVAGQRTRLTAEGAVVGTPEYMSPEQAQGDDVDGRSDLYALGVIAFEMLTGRVPFRADSIVGTLTMQVYDNVPRLREVAPGLRELPATEHAIRMLLSKRIDQRPATSSDAVRLLREALAADGGQVSARGRATVALGSWSVGDLAVAATGTDGGYAMAAPPPLAPAALFAQPPPGPALPGVAPSAFSPHAPASAPAPALARAAQPMSYSSPAAGRPVIAPGAAVGPLVASVGQGGGHVAAMPGPVGGPGTYSQGAAAAPPPPRAADHPTGGIRTARSRPGLPPAALIAICVGAAVFAALVTLSILKWMEYQRAHRGQAPASGASEARHEDAPSATGSRAAENVAAGAGVSAPASDPAGGGNPAAPDLGPGLGGAGETGTATDAVATDTATAKVGDKSRGKKASKSGSTGAAGDSKELVDPFNGASDGQDSKQGQSAGGGEAAKPNPKDQKGSPDVSLDDLKDPFAKP